MNCTKSGGRSKLVFFLERRLSATWEILYVRRGVGLPENKGGADNFICLVVDVFLS